MAQPVDVTPVGLELYNACLPLAYADEQNGYALLRYLDALVHGAQKAATYGRDVGNKPGWAIMMDPFACPPEALEWLAQFAGVNLGTLQQATIITAQNLVNNPNFNYDTLNAAPAKWVGSEMPVFKVTEGWAAGKKALAFETAVLASAAKAYARGQGTTTLEAEAGFTLVKELESYSIRASYNLTTVTGAGLKVKLTVIWYNINKEVLSEQHTTVAAATGVQSITNSVTAPAAAVACLYQLSFTSEAAGSKVIGFIDEVMLAPSPTKAILPYEDGDFTGWVWLGTKGASQQNRQALQSEEEFLTAKRKRIAELVTGNRGTPAAIISTVKQFLTGNKTVFLQERDGGPYKLTIVTYESETPSQAQVRSALEDQIPAGIILTYTVVPGATYILVRATYKTYKAVKEAFVTYNGLRRNLPGT